MCNEFTEADLDRVGMPVGRRSFAALLGVGALTAVIPARAMTGKPVKGRDVSIATPDGTADAYFVAPATGKHPAVLIWPDIRGLRPAFRQMAERLAGDGYAVLCINPFYRSAKAPVVQPGDDFSNPAVREKLTEMAKLLNAASVARDAKALFDFIDIQPEVDTAHMAGVTGYCMGGPMTIATAATLPDRIGAAASFHGGGVATDAADSPHLRIAATKAGYLFAIADNDDARDPGAKDRLNAVLADRPQWHEVEVYKGAMHGWCPPDGRAYDEAAAEKAWGRMLVLFAASL